MLTLPLAISKMDSSASDRTQPVSCRLKVGGITPFSASDYPGKLAAVIFVQGCPWRCGYCHNPHLQPRTQHSPLPWQQVLDLLKRRQGLIDAVVFSGGEPTMDPALPEAIAEARALGYQIGLHSGGGYPQRLAGLLPELDWVALDIKAPFDQYDKITGIANSGRQALACAEAILASDTAYEFRTTVHPDLHSMDDVLALASTLAGMGVKNYALQAFRSTGCDNDELNAAAMAGFPDKAVVQQVAALFPVFSFRPA